MHEARQILYATQFDEVENTLPFSFFIYERIKPKRKKKRKRKVKYHLSSHIEFSRFREIIKKGVIKKIEEKRKN